MCATQAHRKAILSFERQAAAQQQEENAAERVEVGGGAVFPSERELRRPVLGCSQQYTGRGQRAGAACDAREPEVGGDDTSAPSLDQDVRRRQVTVHNSSSVCVGERLRDRSHVGGGLAGREREPATRRLREVGTVDVLHDQERLLVVRYVVVDANDVPVRERRKRARFAVEAAQLCRIWRDQRAQHLDRDLAVELAVAGAPNDAHTPFADLVEQLVAGGQHRHRRSSAPLELSAGSDTATTPLSMASLYRRRSGAERPGSYAPDRVDGVRECRPPPSSDGVFNTDRTSDQSVRRLRA